MKVLVDMNLPPRLADVLVEKGIGAIHWCTVGSHDAKDVEIVEYAYKNDYIILTCDLDFSTLLSISRDEKPSIVQIRVQCFQTDKLAALISAALMQNINEIEKGAILTIDAKRARLRLLPLSQNE